MKTIYRAENIVDAHLVRNALESVGIPAHVAGEYLTGAIGELPAMGLVAVMVADSDVERAAEIAAEIDADLADARLLASSDPTSDPEPVAG
jgi:predicted nucleic acid-binding protein